MNASDITSNSAVVTWLSPNDQGTGGPVKYKIVCNSCPGKTEYTGNETGSNFTLSNLGSYKKYNISVIAVNNVTEVIGKSNAEDVVFQTKLGGTFLFLSFKIALASLQLYQPFLHQLSSKWYVTKLNHIFANSLKISQLCCYYVIMTSVIG